MKLFVDITYPDGRKRDGTIAFPESDAVAIRDDIKAEHPDWHVELNPLQGTP